MAGIMNWYYTCLNRANKNHVEVKDFNLVFRKTYNKISSRFNSYTDNYFYYVLINLRIKSKYTINYVNILVVIDLRKNCYVLNERGTRKNVYIG